MGAAELAGKRLIGGAQPLQPIVRVRIVTQNRSTFTFRQSAPHAVVSLRLESIGETFEANLAFVAAHTNLTLGGTLHKTARPVRWTRRVRGRPSSGRRLALTSWNSTSLYFEPCL